MKTTTWLIILIVYCLIGFIWLCRDCHKKGGLTWIGLLINLLACPMGVFILLIIGIYELGEWLHGRFPALRKNVF